MKGNLVSIDAMACEKDNADLIAKEEGFYLLALKKNQRNAFEQISERMLKNKEGLLSSKNVDFGSGRIEQRTCYIDTNLVFYDALSEWNHLKTVVMIESSLEINGKITHENRFYLSNLEASPEQFNRMVRNHWQIENNLHWMLDVVFKEDVQRTKKENAPDNLSTLRKMALQLLKQIEDKHSIKNRRKKAGWNNQYLMSILSKIQKPSNLKN